MTGGSVVEALRAIELIARTGRVTRISPTYIEADGPSVGLGALCKVEASPTQAGGAPRSIMVEVISVHGDSIILVPLEKDAAIVAGARVTADCVTRSGPVGDGFCGRVVDGLGRPIDQRSPIRPDRYADLNGAATAPLSRTTPPGIVATGIRAIDAFLPLGRGQRVGVFAASGVGKTRLMAQFANQMEADRCVIALVGERGREVEALWHSGLTAEARARTTVVVATADQPAALRIRACDYALALATHWRDRHHHVLLLIDSITRMAMALREVGLAAGEPPTLRGYTPSVFAAIPRLVERCGALRSGGAVTAIMTVLAETDDVDDPICEMMRSLLDGHVVLSRDLAEKGQFPAIDIPRSISRLATDLMNDQHAAAAAEAIAQLSTYQSSRTLIEAGLYVPGTNTQIDRAVAGRAPLTQFLKQKSSECHPWAQSRQALIELVKEST